MRYMFFSLLTVVLLLTIIIGCSGDSQTPVLPGLGNSPDAGMNSPSAPDMNGDRTGEDSANETPDLTDDQFPLQGQPLQVSHALWGLYDIMIDVEAGTFEVVPLRNADFHLNAIKFLEPGGKAGMLTLASKLNFNVDKTQLDLDVQIQHPFSGLNQFSGFDVKGILITHGSLSGFSDSSLMLSGMMDMNLKNADGLTRWWNPEEFVGNSIFSYNDGALGMKDANNDFKATLNGFKYFADALDKDQDMASMDLTDRGVFRAGNANIRHYTIGLPNGLLSIRFNYAIDASWEPAIIKPPVNIPGDFPISANQPEPYLIETLETLNTLYFEDLANNGGMLELDIRVYDWQDATPVPMGGIEKVVAEWPALFAPTEAEFVSDMGDYGLYHVSLVPVIGALTSTTRLTYMVWAESVDGDGYGGILDPSIKLTSFDTFTALVADTKPNTPPQILDGVNGNSSPGLFSEQYTVTAQDIDAGDTLEYLWSVEPLGALYNFDDAGNGDGTLDVDWAALGIGQYTVQCQVNDTKDFVEATALDIMVGNTPPSLGDIEGLLEVQATDTSVKYTVPATDPDAGQTLTFSWSFVPTGQPEDFSIPGDIGDGSMTVDFSGVDPGDYDINVQVTDGFTPVTGSAIDIIHNNTAPTVGDVTGPSPVNISDTDALYDATKDDPDTTQTLSAMWSVVPEGDAEDFSIASNPDGSVNIDWSGYSEGNYDVNVRVSDGIDSSDGTKQTVIRLADNLPPTVGDISGPTPVTHQTTSADYTALMNDPDGDTLIVLWSVVPNGQPEDFSIVGSEGNPLNVDWSTIPDIGDYDINVQLDDSINAPVTGTPFTVTLDNIPPLAGAVSGATKVTCANTAEPFSAPYSDLDFGQSLTIMWSVVPTGNSASYVIPAEIDGSLIYDWSSEPLGDYDVNLRVDDGFAQVEGTLLTVTKQNQPPSVGNITGPAVTTDEDTEDYSIVPPATDCDAGQTLTYMYSIVPDGNTAVYDIPSADGSLTVDWSSYGIGLWAMGCEVSDGIESSFAGTLVVQVNMGACVGGVHSFDGNISIGTYSVAAMSILPRADIAYMDGGIGGIKGKGLAQIGPSTIGIFDADGPGSPSVTFSYFLGKMDAAVSLDTDPIEGRILAVTVKDPDLMKVIDSSIIFGNAIKAQLNYGDPDITWVCADVDSNGDIYAIARDATSGVAYTFYHWIWETEENDFYTLDIAAVDITPQVGAETDIFDLAIDQENRKIFVLEAGTAGNGTIHVYDITPFGVVHTTTTTGIFSQDLDFDEGGFTGFAGYADIDIDHVDSDMERCRVVVYGRLSDLSGELVRFDNEMNLLSSNGFIDAQPAFAINPNADDTIRNLIMPDTDVVRSYDSPGDW
ncbi:MAG TPA: hypothetical protein VGB30_08070 [bacterium]